MAEPQVSVRTSPVVELAVTDLETGLEFAVIDSGPRCADTLAAYLAADPAQLRVEVVRGGLARAAGAA